MKITIQSSPYQYKDVCRTEDGDPCSIVYTAHASHTNREFIVVKFPAKTVRIGYNPSYRHPVYFGVFSKGELLQTSSTTYELEAKIAKVFNVGPYQTERLSFYERKLQAVKYADDCAQFGAEATHAKFYGYEYKAEVSAKVILRCDNCGAQIDGEGHTKSYDSDGHDYEDDLLCESCWKEWGLVQAEG